MTEITKNPPLAAYYSALIGRLAGWSESALHTAFILPAVAVVLGTYRLARRFTKHSALAAIVTLLAPGFFVSALSVMADVMLMGFWIWAMVLWIEGIEQEKKSCLLGAALLVAFAELTKYMGVFLVPLLAFYALAGKRKLLTWAPYLLLPLAVLGGYEYWGHLHYSRGLFLSAAQYARDERRARHLTKFASALVGLSFAGGSIAAGLLFAPLLWSRRQIAVASAAITASMLIVGFGLTRVATPHAHAHWIGMCVEMGVFLASGVSFLALAVADWGRRDHLSWFLAAWVFGVFWFAVYTNYAVNVRSVIPLLPPAAILVARRLEKTCGQGRASIPGFALPVALTAALTIWIAAGDTAFGEAQRVAAESLRQDAQGGRVWFEGRWGFEYYMEREGARPFDANESDLRAGDLLVMPSLQDMVIPNRRWRLERSLHFDVPARVATQNWDLGAGFYSSRHGPLPFAFGPVAYEFYILRLES